MELVLQFKLDFTSGHPDELKLNTDPLQQVFFSSIDWGWKLINTVLVFQTMRSKLSHHRDPMRCRIKAEQQF